MEQTPYRTSADVTATALFFAETRNHAEVEELADIARDLSIHGDAMLLSEGVITAYALRMPVAALPMLATLETTLKTNFVFGRVEAPFQETMHRVIEDLAIATGSRLSPLEECELCHAPVPFPADLHLMGEDGKTHRSHSTYCIHCANQMSAGETPEAAVEDAPAPRRKSKASA